MALKFRCNKCNEEIIVKFLKQGETAQCMHCGACNIVPENAVRVPFDIKVLNLPTIPIKPYPGIIQAIGLLVLYLGISFGLGFQVGWLSIAIDYPLAKSNIVMNFVSIISWVLVIYIGYKTAKMPFKKIFPLIRFKWSPVILVIVLYIGIRLFWTGFSNLSFKLILSPGIAEAASNSLVTYYKRLYDSGFLLSFLIVVIFMPILEEFIFRGLVLHGFLQRYSMKKAVVAAALIFGIIHIHPILIVYGTILGLLVGWLFVITKSLLPCVIVHSFGNLIGMLSYFIYVKDIQYTNVMVDKSVYIEVICIILGLVISIIFIDLLSSKIKKSISAKA